VSYGLGRQADLQPPGSSLNRPSLNFIVGFCAAAAQCRGTMGVGQMGQALEAPLRTRSALLLPALWFSLHFFYRFLTNAFGTWSLLPLDVLSSWPSIRASTRLNR
jgi:hypothetical protein